MTLTLPDTPTDRSVPGDGITLHARDWGGGAARAVVLLHGLSSNARIWDGVAPRLAAAGLRAVAIDQRGHGESEQPSSGYDFATVTGDLAHALEALGIRAPLLVGHSWGANVALQYAADRPGGVAGLALVDGGFGDVADWAGGDLEEVRRRLRPPRFAVPLETWLAGSARWLPPGVDPSEPWVAEFLRAGVEVDAGGIATARFHFDNHMQVIDALYEQRPSRLLAELTCPVLLCPAGGRAAPARSRGESTGEPRTDAPDPS
ncbi:MAG TPA: alpha/beta hydrolase, partial [Actinomycetes bacterium]|nr:alpha/beta hydrolase [Actinomycetes bacterium]